ncbi:MAG: hypothetical protein EB010_12155, partial [Acidimicrobiia bacterium]|nr:hypothetical protein [Acidimicrobiia bacterium]
FEFTCALLDDRSLKCWGRNGLGELGSGTAEGGIIGDHAIGDSGFEMASLIPLDITSTFNAARVIPGDADSEFSCAIDTQGRVKCWGRNAYGQLGIGAVDDRGNAAGEMGNSLPYVDLGTGRTATSMSAGYSHTCAILDNGRVKCWGLNDWGQLGLGDMNDRSDGPGEMGDNLAYVNLGTGRTATAISAGKYFTCALLDNGRVKCWGINGSGQLGLGVTTPRGTVVSDMGDNLPSVDLGTGRTATAISAGDNHACAILDNSTLKCWGDNNYGQLGLGDLNGRGDAAGEMGDNLAAVDLGTGRTASVIASGNDYTCAILDNGTVKCWGRNNFGQLGRDSLSDLLPLGDGAGEMGTNLLAVNLGAGRTARAIDANGWITCAVLDNSTLKCWGRARGHQPRHGSGPAVGRYWR